MLKLPLPKNRGFTLIELLVVIIIIGILAAIALPRLLGQTAKGKEAEAKSNLGAINRAQQSYRFEKATFGNLTDLAVTVGGNYYSFTGGDRNQTLASHSATALTAHTQDIKDHASGVAQNAAGQFSNIICINDHPTVALGAIAGSGAGLTCGANSSAIN